MLPLALLLAVAAWLPAPQDAAEAPATADRVQEFLDRSAARLYRAEQAGLTGLSFRIPFELPRLMVEPLVQQLGLTMPPGTGDQVRFGDLAVSWTAGQPPDVQLEPAEGLPATFQQVLAQLGPEYEGRAMTALDMALSRNADVRQLLRDFDAQLTDNESGLDQVIFTPRRSDYPLPIARLVWYFDEEGVPVKTVMESQQPDPSGTITVTRTQTNHWRPASEDDDSLVLDWALTIEDAGQLGTATSEISFEYDTFDGIVLLTGFTETNEAEGQSFVSEVTLRDIVVQRGS